MKYEIQNSNSINFLIEQPMINIGERKFYKCSFNKSSLKKGSSLYSTDLYYITKDHNEINSGAYLSMIFDDNREKLLLFEFIKKPNEDQEALLYCIMEFIKNLKYDVDNFEKSKDGTKYINITIQ